MDSSKHDWGLFTERLPLWQENYIQKLNDEYSHILFKKNLTSSERFWELEKRINQDKKSPGVMLELDKNNMELDIMRLLKDGAITIEDLSDFSDELKDRVKAILK